MSMAEVVGIKVVPHALIKANDEFVYITKRIDRINKNNKIIKLGMEDFQQLSLRASIDKYSSSYEKCMKIIDEYSSRKRLDKVELFIRVLFSYIVGNSDMHLKNFSLIQIDKDSSSYYLSPSYDLLSTKIVLNKDEEDLALTLNGKKKNITKNDFLKFAVSSSIEEKVALKIILDMCSKKDLLIKLCEESYLNDKQKKDLISLINKRVNILNK